MAFRPERHGAKPRNIPCRKAGCHMFFRTVGGLRSHLTTMHRLNTPTPPSSPPASPAAGSQGDAMEGIAFNDEDEPLGNAHFDAQVPEPPAQTQAKLRVVQHATINGTPCTADGNPIEDPANPPRPPSPPPPTDWTPYDRRTQFEMADLLFRRAQISGGHIDDLFEILIAELEGLDTEKGPLYGSKQDLYDTIDATKKGEIAWECFEVSYNEALPETPEPWMTRTHQVWFRNPREVLHAQLGNPDFKSEMDYAPKQVFSVENDERQYCDFMSGNWAWKQADVLAGNPRMHGATLCPIILGSDKTTVSVATGQNDYWPLYISNGLIHNNVRRAHRNGLTLVGFLSVPKTDRAHKDSVQFRTFRRRLFHESLREMLGSLKNAMEEPEVVLFGDGKYRRVVYSLGPYIGDYPEQVLLACVVQGWCPRCTSSAKNLDGQGGRRSHEHTELVLDAFSPREAWDEYGIIANVVPFTTGFPRADIHEMLSPDLLHQLIKGTFKDHLVEWVGEYLEITHGKAGAARVMSEIDRRIAAAPPFPGLRRFPHGRGFSQWTGDDSKALMKVYLAAIAGLVPSAIVQALSAFTEFCYIARRDVITDTGLQELEAALRDFHRVRTVFETAGVRSTGFSLPRQHSMTHYAYLIREFGSPNGLCSSITESKHIKAVKEPWRRSSRFEALGQMLLTNQRIDKLAAARVDFHHRGMLSNSLVPMSQDKANMVARLVGEQEDPNSDDDEQPFNGKDIMGEVKLAARKVPGRSQDVNGIAHELNLPSFPVLLQRFLYEHLLDEDDPDDIDIANVPLDDLPSITSRIRVFPSAVATFFAPSDLSGVGGMKRERIRATPQWRGGPARYDTVFVNRDPDEAGFRGLHVARVKLLFSFSHEGVVYPCALVSWFSAVGDTPCPDTRMWVVSPDIDNRRRSVMSVIHVDSILRSAHLLGRAGRYFTPLDLTFSDTLDSYKTFYVNKYADYHAHEIAF